MGSSRRSRGARTFLPLADPTCPYSWRVAIGGVRLSAYGRVRRMMAVSVGESDWVMRRAIVFFVSVAGGPMVVIVPPAGDGSPTAMSDSGRACLPLVGTRK